MVWKPVTVTGQSSGVPGCLHFCHLSAVLIPGSWLGALWSLFRPLDLSTFSICRG